MSDEEPPAAQVISTQKGLVVPILSILSRRFSIPASVLAGKYSKEYRVFLGLLSTPPSANAA